MLVLIKSQVLKFIEEFLRISFPEEFQREKQRQVYL